ncbi:MAG: immunoglobulin domain-containing protein [Verrucomicrobiota bacterium]
MACSRRGRLPVSASRGPRPGLALAAVAGLAVLAPALPAQTPTTPQAPVILTQPVDRTVYFGQTATFAVEATGNPSPAFQWLFKGAPLPGATNNPLVLTNASFDQLGLYGVVVTNAAGSVTSTNASLLVLPTPLPGLAFGAYDPGSGDPAAPASASIPVRFTGSGRETNLTFSLAFQTNTLANPRFTPNLLRTRLASPAEERVSTVVTVLPGTPSGLSPGPTVGEANPPALPGDTQLVEDRSQVAGGFYGLRLVLPAGQTLEIGEQVLGTVQFDRLAGSARFAAGLAFTTNPVPVSAGQTNGSLAFPGTLPPPPVFTLAQPLAVLDRQTGLMLQRGSLANPGAVTLPNARLGIVGLTNDTLGIPIRVYNAPNLGVDPSVAQILLPDLQPAEDRPLTLEFYVADLKTQPGVTFLTETFPALPAPALPTKLIPITKTQYFTSAAYPAGAFLLEWLTSADRRYLIQYAPTLGGLDDPAAVRTVGTLLSGTGSRLQWIDSGPPKTIAQPGANSRFYRVLETR